MHDLLGVVLCGGKSKRMGADKGLLAIGGSIWSKHVAEKLIPFNIPIVFSVNAKQLKDYRVYIDPEKLIVDNSDIQGPLNGLVSVHKRYPENNLLLLACDMLDLDKPTIKKCIETYEREDSFDFYVYQDESFAQPFCGIYKARGLRKVLKLASAHGLTKFSFQSVLDNGVTKRISIDNASAFKNYNAIGK